MSVRSFAVNKELTKSLNIAGIPVIALYEGRVEVRRVFGYQSEPDLRKLLAQFK